MQSKTDSRVARTDGVPFLQRLRSNSPTCTRQQVCWCGWEEMGHYFEYHDLAEALTVNSTLKELCLADPTHLPSHSMAQEFRASETTARYLARALRVNTTLRRLELPRQEVHHTVGDFGIQGAIEIGLALRDAPRSPAEFELVGLDLSCAWEKFGLPPEAKTWSNPKIMQAFWNDYTERMLAFSMGLHARLGNRSPMQELNDECLRLVCSACWGN